MKHLRLNIKHFTLNRRWNLLLLFCPSVVMAQQFLVTVKGDTIMDGKWFPVTIEALAPPGGLVNLMAVPAYPESLGDVVEGELFPSAVDFGGAPLWDGTLFYRLNSDENEWIKIIAWESAMPDSSSTLFAWHGPFESDNPRNQIRIIPNPIGALGLPAEITVFAVRVMVKKGKQIEAKIFDSFGHLVKEIKPDDWICTEVGMNAINQLLPTKKFSDNTADPNSLSGDLMTLRTRWDGRNDKGNKVANGVYHISIKMMQAEEAGSWKEKIGVIW